MNDRMETIHELQRAAMYALEAQFAIRLMSMGFTIRDLKTGREKALSFVELAVTKVPDLLINLMKEMR
jgi:nucleoside-triphosphatase THEP1